MSDQDKPHIGDLVPTGSGDLATSAAGNPLVSRGIADLAKYQKGYEKGYELGYKLRKLRAKMRAAGLKPKPLPFERNPGDALLGQTTQEPSPEQPEQPEE